MVYQLLCSYDVCDWNILSIYFTLDKGRHRFRPRDINLIIILIKYKSMKNTHSINEQKKSLSNSKFSPLQSGQNSYRLNTEEILGSYRENYQMYELHQ